MLKRTAWVCGLGMLLLASASSVQATVFMSDEFEYANGQLTDNGGGANVSGGRWNDHSGATEFVQVVDGQADVRINFTEDVNRDTNVEGDGLDVQADGTTWYYGARITVNDQRIPPDTTLIGSNYFMHFKDTGTFNLMGRLYVTPPLVDTDPGFQFGLSSYSVNAGGGQIVEWGSDLPFATEYIVVVSITSADDNPLTTNDGHSQLWVNPVNIGSTSIIDTMPHPDFFTPDPGTLGDRDDMSALALRGANAGNQNPQILVDEVAIGDDFEDVLAAVSEAPVADADFDNDGDVDGDDFLTWQANVGIGDENSEGDVNGDNVVDEVDLALWNSLFGTGATSAPAAGAIPEPATLALAALSAAAVLALGRRRRPS
jgi:PEP-CTERM motif